MKQRLAVPAGAVVVALVASACGLAWRTDSPLVPTDGGTPGGRAPLFLALLIGAFTVYVLALLLIRRSAPTTRAVVVVAALIQLVPLAAPLLLSTDAWTYWSYGWIGSFGDGNPYVSPPQDFPDNPALPYMGSDWLETTSVYGPAFTIVSEPLAVVAGDSANVAAWTYKTLAAVASLAAALLAGRIARRRAFAIALVGWNPVLAVHLAGSGHNDAWVGAFIVAALALSSTRARGAGAFWALAILVKWVPLVFLALHAVEAAATRRLVGYRGLLAAGAVVTASATALYGGSWLGALLPLAQNVSRQTGYGIPHRLEQAGLPETLALAIPLTVLLVGMFKLTRDAGRGRARLGLAACLVLLATPYLAVWYLAWTVPLAAADEDRTATILALGLCAYLLPQTIPV